MIVVSLSGFDENLASTVHARHTYPADRVLFGRRFVDVLAVGPDGERIIDYTRFHDTAPER